MNRERIQKAKNAQRPRYYVCLNVYPAFKRSFDRWNSTATDSSEFSHAQSDAQIFGYFNVHKFTLNIAALCIISAVVRIVFVFPTILVPYDVNDGVPRRYSLFMSINKGQNVLESFLLIVVSCALMANYRGQYAHCYFAFVFYMILSAISCLCRLILSIIVFQAYPLSHKATQLARSKRLRSFCIHIVGSILSILIYLTLACIVIKVRRIVLNEILQNENEKNESMKSRIWQFMTAHQRRQHWATNGSHQRPITTISQGSLQA